MITKNTLDLLPCPFCGGEAKTHGPYGWYHQWAITHNCRAMYNGGSEAFQHYPTEAYAIEAWNTRTPDPAMSERIAELEKAIGEAREIMLCTPELNMSNYDHDDVDLLNKGMIEAFVVLEAALSQGEDR